MEHKIRVLIGKLFDKDTWEVRLDYMGIIHSIKLPMSDFCEGFHGRELGKEEVVELIKFLADGL